MGERISLLLYIFVERPKSFTLFCIISHIRWESKWIIGLSLTIIGDQYNQKGERTVSIGCPHRVQIHINWCKLVGKENRCKSLPENTTAMVTATYEITLILLKRQMLYHLS